MKRKIPDDDILIDTMTKRLRTDKPIIDDIDYSDDEPEDGNRFLGLIFILLRQIQRIF